VQTRRACVKKRSIPKRATRSAVVTRNAISHTLSPKEVKVVVAGGGLGGLFLAICLNKRGFDATVVEKTKQFRAYGGPIQLASNGMSVLKAVSESLYKDVQDNSRPFWGTRSGIKDGLTAKWMFRFDAITEIPRQRELPFAVCIDRSDLQKCLLAEINRIKSSAVDEEYGQTQVLMGTSVESYSEDETGTVSVMLNDGTELRADILVGADGIWSSVRARMFGEPINERGSRSNASDTGYRLFSGLPIFESPDYFDIGYCAYVGPEHYFVKCPDRCGRMQWYAFIKSEPYDRPIEEPLEYLMDIFESWSPEIKELLAATECTDIKQRHLWDRSPCILKGWSDGHVTLLGDSCHATMPNIGQGTGLAFEDAFLLVELIESASSLAELPMLLRTYYEKRIIRTATIQGLGRMNSEAIKILTPLLPIKPLVDFVVSPFLPLVFQAQFGYCYAFSPAKETVVKSISDANRMQQRHSLESESSWKDRLGKDFGPFA
jgi:zeaxanthin epoxidase